MNSENHEYDGILRRKVRAFLEEIDAELASLDADQQDYCARDEKIKRLMIAPPFLAAAKCHSPAAPLVSIVLPTRNRAGFIGDAIASVQAQSYANWELIIVDDCSQDDTSDVVAAFLPDRRIRFFRQEFAGQSVARNGALRRSSGELIAYIDSDNLWYPHFLAAAVVLLSSSPDVDCVYGALVSDVHLAPPKTLLFDDFGRDRLLCNNYIDLNTFVHRKTLVDRYGGFDEGLTRLVDWDLILRFTQDKTAHRVPVLAARYRVVDDQRVTVTCPLVANQSMILRKWQDDGKP